MPPISVITNHVEQALSLLADQWKDDPVMVAFTSAFTARVQELETLIAAVESSRSIDNRLTHDLDVLGKVFQRGRRSWGGDLNDAGFKFALKLWIRALRTKGRWKDLDAILVLAGRDYLVTFGRETVWIESLGPTGGDGLEPYPTVLAQALARAKKGGVNLLFSWSPTDPEKIFRFSTIVTATDLDDLEGFGSVNHPDFPDFGSRWAPELKA